MSARLKLVVIILFVALVPLSVSAWTTLQLHVQALDGALSELHQKAAEHGAGAAQSYLEQTQEQLASLSRKRIPWDRLSVQEQEGALRLLYGENNELFVTALLDGKGRSLSPSVYLDEEARAREAGHPSATEEALRAFADHIPFADAKGLGAARSRAFVFENARAPAVALAFAVDGAPKGRTWVVAAGLSLERLCRQLTDARPANTQVSLTDNRGHYLCGSRTELAPLAKLDPSLQQSLTDTGCQGQMRFTNRSGNEILASCTSTALGWNVLTEQPVTQALAASTRIRDQTLLWIAIGVLAAVSAGFLLTGEINRALEMLIGGVKQVAVGNFGYRLKEARTDEFGKLARAFDQMCEEIERRDAEIRAWNAELQERVEERTRELHESQRQLMESRKIAAVASLGVGIAHEINNPLTSVLGITQVLKAKHKQDVEQRMLGLIEHQAFRIRDIVDKVQSLSLDQAGAGFVRLNMAEILEQALSDESDRVAETKVQVERQYRSDLPDVFGNRSQLVSALKEVISNALLAMAKRPGQLTLTLDSVQNELVKTTIGDTGEGIRPEVLEKIFEPFFTTKHNWSGEGLGLSVAYRIIEAHRGRMKVDSVLGQGTTMTITLPAARLSAHMV